MFAALSFVSNLAPATTAFEAVRAISTKTTTIKG